MEERIAAKTRIASEEISKPKNNVRTESVIAKRRMVRSVPATESVAIGAKYRLKFLTGTRRPLEKSIKAAKRSMMTSSGFDEVVSETNMT